jgi:hypothetical protein
MKCGPFPNCIEPHVCGPKGSCQWRREDGKLTRDLASGEAETIAIQAADIMRCATRSLTVDPSGGTFAVALAKAFGSMYDASPSHVLLWAETIRCTIMKKEGG